MQRKPAPTDVSTGSYRLSDDLSALGEIEHAEFLRALSKESRAKGFRARLARVLAYVFGFLNSPVNGARQSGPAHAFVEIPLGVPPSTGQIDTVSPKRSVSGPPIIFDDFDLFNEIAPPVRERFPQSQTRH